MYHSVEINVKCHLANKLLNYNLILDRSILHDFGIIFNFHNLPLTWQQDSLSMKPPHCTAKEFFVIKESRPVGNTTKCIKQILDTEYKKINLKSIIMNLNYLMDNHFRNIKKCLMEP